MDYFCEYGTPRVDGTAQFVFVEFNYSSGGLDLGWRIRMMDCITILLPWLLETVILITILTSKEMRRRDLFMVVVYSSLYDWLARAVIPIQFLTDCIPCTLQGVLDSIGLNASLILQVLLSLHLCFIAMNSPAVKRSTSLILRPGTTALAVGAVCTVWQLLLLPYYRHEDPDVNPLFGRCWIPSAHQRARLLAWWAVLPLYLATLTYCAVRVILHGRQQSRQYLGVRVLGRSAEMRLMLFPIGSVVFWTPPSINRLVQASGGYSAALESLHSVSRGLGGIVYVIILYTNTNYQRATAHKQAKGSRPSPCPESSRYGSPHHSVASSPRRMVPV